MVSLLAMSSSHDAAISHKGEKRRNYDMSFKLEAIEYAERVSNNAAAKKYKVDVKCIRKWHKNKQSIAELKEKHKGQGRKKLDRGGRKAVDSDLDDIILEWIYGRRANGLRVSQKLIMVKAKHSYDERCPEGKQDMFKATEGWLQKFMLRHGLSLRRKTTTAQQDPHRLIAKLLSFILQVRRLSR